MFKSFKKHVVVSFSTLTTATSGIRLHSDASNSFPAAFRNYRKHHTPRKISDKTRCQLALRFLTIVGFDVMIGAELFHFHEIFWVINYSGFVSKYDEESVSFISFFRKAAVRKIRQ